MSNPFKTKEFKVLEDLWYKKLKQSGFDDIEPGPRYLKYSIESILTRKYNLDRKLEYKKREEYFRIAGQFLYEYEFKDEISKIVWELHSEGSSIRKISKRLSDLGKKRATTQVKETIHEIRTIMFEKYNKDVSDE